MRGIHRHLTIVVWMVVSVGMVSCVADDATGRFELHANAVVWVDAARGVTRDPWQWGPAVALAVAIPVAYANDTAGSARAIRNRTFSGKTSDGDRVMNGMIIASGALAAGEWLYGDDGSATEVFLESSILTAGVVKLLKDGRSRRRPQGSTSNSSFPSGHATMAFVAATFIARRVEDQVDGWQGYLGYLTYLPAAAVALNRVENGRHYPSDVLAGALIGSLLTNVVYNAHYGSNDGRGIYQRPPMSFVTQVDGDTVGVGMRFTF